MQTLDEMLFSLGLGSDPALRTQGKKELLENEEVKNLKAEVENLRNVIKTAQISYISTLTTLSETLRNPDDETREVAAAQLDDWLAQATQTRH